MNATRNLAQNVLRCSQLSCRSLSTAHNLMRYGRLNPSSLGHNVSRPSLPSVFVRAMSSTAKFEVINVQDEDDFNKRVIEASSSVPVVVDFHATWCGPCKILGPRLESMLSKEDGKVLMAKIDIDENPELAMEYGVRSVPMVVGVKNGKVQSQFVGVIDNDQISTFVDKLVVS